MIAADQALRQDLSSDPTTSRSPSKWISRIAFSDIFIGAALAVLVWPYAPEALGVSTTSVVNTGPPLR
jgi:hypothetical protein